MSYETAPATRLLATKCAVCGRPLVDAESVEIGMGPECRKQNGLEADNPKRAEANKLVHRLALFRSQHELAPPVESVVEMLSQLEGLGYVKLREVLTQRLAAVVIKQEGVWLELKAPFKATAQAKLRALNGAQPASWRDGPYIMDRAMRWRFHVGCRNALWAILKEEYPGMLGTGPQGSFAIKERAKPVQMELT